MPVILWNAVVVTTDTADYSDFSIKAPCADLHSAEQTLLKLGAKYVGEDFQTDTYFHVPVGKMKLREGNIEYLLTHYQREEVKGKMKTTVFLYERNPTPEIVRERTGKLQKLGQITKARHILFIDNVKFHLDRFGNGRHFIEIEAIDKDGTLGIDTIQKQAEKYRKLLGIRSDAAIASSYIDMNV